MSTATNTTFFAGTACYLVAAALVLAYLYHDSRRWLPVATAVLVVGALGYGTALALRAAQWGRLPLTTMTDGIALFAIFATLVMLLFVWRYAVFALLCFFVPPLAMVCAITSFVAARDLSTPPQALPTLPLALHAGSAFLAYTLFFLASITSAAYLFQVRRLKQHPTGRLFRRLPSLEQLDQSLYRLIVWGCVLYVVALSLGVVWAGLESDLLAATWWTSPKVVLAWITALFFLLVFLLRRFRGFRGPKLAYVILAGFTCVLLLYLLLGVAEVRTFNFWEAAACR